MKNIRKFNEGRLEQSEIQEIEGIFYSIAEDWSMDQTNKNYAAVGNPPVDKILYLISISEKYLCDSEKPLVIDGKSIFIPSKFDGQNFDNIKVLFTKRLRTNNEILNMSDYNWDEVKISQKNNYRCESLVINIWIGKDIMPRFSEILDDVNEFMKTVDGYGYLYKCYFPDGNNIRIFVSTKNSNRFLVIFK